MGLFDAFKKNENVLPEVGEEDKFEAKKQIEESVEEESPVQTRSQSFLPKEVLERVKSKGQTDKREVLRNIKNEAEASDEEPAQTNISKNAVQSNSTNAVPDNLATEKINVRLEEIKMRDEQINARISQINESIGELRSLSMNNEKKIEDAMKDANRVIDVFNEVKPDILRLDYQKIEMRLKTVEEKVGAHRNMVDSVVTEFKNLRNRADAFLGTEGMIKLNEDVKKDLVESQRLIEKARMHAETTKDIFLELKTNFEESQRVGTMASNINEEFMSLKAELERLKIHSGNIVKRAEYDDFRKLFGNKLATMDNLAPQIEKFKDEQQELVGLVEDSFALAKRNSEDISDISLKVGGDGSKGIEDYENRLADILSILESLVDEVNVLKGKSGNEEEVSVPQDELKERMSLLKENINSDNIEGGEEEVPDENLEESSEEEVQPLEEDVEEVQPMKKKLKKTPKTFISKVKKSSAGKSFVNKKSDMSNGSVKKKSDMSNGSVKKKSSISKKQKEGMLVPKSFLQKNVQKTTEKVASKKFEPAKKIVNSKPRQAEKLMQKLNNPKGVQIPPKKVEKIPPSVKEVVNSKPVGESLSLPFGIDVEPLQEKPSLKDKIFGFFGKKEE